MLRDERVMKRIRERKPQLCVALSKKAFAEDFVRSRTKLPEFHPCPRGNFSFSPHYLYARFGYLPEFSRECFMRKLACRVCIFLEIKLLVLRILLNVTL